MTAATTGRAGGVVLPLRPSAKSTAQHAPTRGRASDARPGEGPSHAAPAGPPAASGMAATEDDTGRGYAARLAGVQAAMSGASLLDAPPPSLAAVWAKHQASAEWYSAGVLRWPRYAYAVFHLWTSHVDPEIMVGTQ